MNNRKTKNQDRPGLMGQRKGDRHLVQQRQDAEPKRDETESP